MSKARNVADLGDDFDGTDLTLGGDLSVSGDVTTTSVSGDGSSLTNLPAPTSSQVGSANAGLSLGDVGTYVYATASESSAVTRAAGTTKSGGSLAYPASYYGTIFPQGYYPGYVNAAGDASNLSGTWRAQNRYVSVNGQGGYIVGPALWLRIS